MTSNKRKMKENEMYHWDEQTP